MKHPQRSDIILDFIYQFTYFIKNLAASGCRKSLWNDFTNILAEKKVKGRYPTYIEAGFDPLNPLQEQAISGRPIYGVSVANF